MESFEAQAVILAPSSVVRDVLTDQGNYPVWNSELRRSQATSSTAPGSVSG
ncbi:hypothetical protein [Arthrobacter sp. Z4-13]